MKLVNFLHLLFLIVLTCCWDIRFSGRQGLFDRFDTNCKDSRKMRLQFHFGKPKMEANIFYMNYTADVLKEIKAIEYKMRIERCKSKESPDTCEEFYKFQTKKYCNMFGANSGAKWAGLYTSIGDNFTCPLQVGHYIFKDVSFDLSAFPLFPVSGWFWKFNLLMLEPDGTEVYSCFTAETTVFFERH